MTTTIGKNTIRSSADIDVCEAIVLVDGKVPPFGPFSVNDLIGVFLRTTKSLLDATKEEDIEKMRAATMKNVTIQVALLSSITTGKEIE